MKTMRSVGPFPNIRKKTKLTEKELSNIIEKIISEYDKKLNKEEDTHGYDHDPYSTIAGDAMGFDGWGDGNISSGSDSSGDFSSPYDDSSEIFDLKESLHKNLRKYL